MNFDKVIDRKGTYCTQWDYIYDRFGHNDLLPFTISDMDFKAPKEIIDCLINRVNHGVFGYSRWNHSDYKSSIKRWYERRFAYSIDEEYVVYSPSVIYAVSKFIELKSKKGDKILVNTPTYDGFLKTIEANERQLLECPFKLIDKEYTIDFNEFEEKCKEAKIYLLCSPHNPIGKVWTEEELLKIIEICEKYSVFIISDEIHMDFTYKTRHIPILKLNRYMDNIVICTSASKTFNIPSLIGAYTLIYNKKDREQFFDIIKNRDSIYSASIMNILSTITAYNKCEYFVDELKEYLYKNLLFVDKYIKENMSELDFIVPDGSYFAWINYNNLGVSSEKFQKYLIDYGKVAIMDGKIYGNAGQNCLRLNVACPISKVEKGLIGIKTAINNL